MVSRRLVDKLITEKHWQPYIAGHWLTARKAGYIITFKDHTTFEYKCSHKIGLEILTLAGSK